MLCVLEKFWLFNFKNSLVIINIFYEFMFISLESTSTAFISKSKPVTISLNYYNLE